MFASNNSGLPSLTGTLLSPNPAVSVEAGQDHARVLAPPAGRPAARAQRQKTPDRRSQERAPRRRHGPSPPLAWVRFSAATKTFAAARRRDASEAEKPGCARWFAMYVLDILTCVGVRVIANVRGACVVRGACAVQEAICVGMRSST